MNLSANLPGLRTVRSPEVPTPARRPWIEHWLETVRDLQDLKDSHPMMDAVIDEIDGRMIRIGDHWLGGLAPLKHPPLPPCTPPVCALGREIIEAVPESLDRWGPHPSWSRLLGSPALYEEIEERLT